VPTQVVSDQVMQVGKKGGGKHWTDAEITARKAVAEELLRDGPVELVAPTWLSSTARTIWDQAIADASETKHLDNLDAEFLAIYCDAVAQYRKHATKKRRTVADIGIQQSWARIVAQYADKLGFTPSARARLIKRGADKKLKDEFGEKFD
jgi:phage terminase small subunit